MRHLFMAAAAGLALTAPSLAQDDLRTAIATDWDNHLQALYEHFHENPELSFMETETAARLAQELRSAGFEVTEGVGPHGRRCSDGERRGADHHAARRHGRPARARRHAGGLHL
jgi:fermentation-respiration switch protein FrsA (DUF1100 family)